jgi:hypothetical protein
MEEIGTVGRKGGGGRENEKEDLKRKVKKQGKRKDSGTKQSLKIKISTEWKKIIKKF